ncbi:antibiotic biosynthesis monooxygenase [Xanthobacter autotrophicus]|uniref:antibiotic biosynthesis monooxygenase n=1 Tax=Xanthobacter TaxID=279 RepID=UPI0024AA388F|nr:antibiotic biosynthesis monooxygenase [Xanthobacter autotrophicus]MDI4664107.1 antibiotic biosynthesis monooxygenase [Xanthobacter autotrophicus]
MSGAPEGSVTIVTQTRVLKGQDHAFADWQEETRRLIAGFPGFIEQSVAPPAPPAQVDWVILQRFASTEDAVGWLKSPERLARISGVQHMLAGRDDVHLVRDGAAGVLPSPVSVVIATRLKSGQEAAYRAWEQRMTMLQSRAPGFEGYRLEAPIPGVQEDFLAILRFDTQEHLEAWLGSPQRRAMLEEARAFIEEFHARTVRTGFEQWFSAPRGKAPPPWKQSMLVLLALYPVVFLFGHLVQIPLLMGEAGLPFAVALFIGNAVSVLLLTRLVPWVSRRFDWWLQSPAPRTDALGAGVILAFYAVLIAVFVRV